MTSYNLYFYSFWKTVPRRIKLCRKFRRKLFLCRTKSILLRIFCLWTLMLIFVETCLSVLAGPGHPGHSNLWLMVGCGGGGGGAWHHMESHWHVACSRDTWPWQCRTRVTRDSLQQLPGSTPHSSSRLTGAIVRGNQNWVSEIEFYAHTSSLLRKLSFILSRSNDVGKKDIDQVWVTSNTNIPLWSICPSLSRHTQTKEQGITEGSQK